MVSRSAGCSASGVARSIVAGRSLLRESRSSMNSNRPGSVPGGTFHTSCRATKPTDFSEAKLSGYLDSESGGGFESWLGMMRSPLGWHHSMWIVPFSRPTAFNLEQIGKRATGLIGEILGMDHKGIHAINSEVPEALSQLTPSSKGPDGPPEENAQIGRAHV